MKHDGVKGFDLLPLVFVDRFFTLFFQRLKAPWANERHPSPGFLLGFVAPGVLGNSVCCCLLHPWHLGIELGRGVSTCQKKGMG